MVPDSPEKLADEITQLLGAFQEKFSEQFSVRIPRGVIQKVDFYRDTYFPYLKDSEYKSNVCYLLQLVDYQIWLYRLFRPSLSLENSYFYQLLVTMGIVSEALVNAILLNPLVISTEEDRSIGNVPEESEYMQRQINKASYSDNLNLLQKLSLLPEETLTSFHEFRREIRNLVHVQNWKGRLYQSLDYNFFRERLNQFKNLLLEVKDKIAVTHDAATLKEMLFGGDLIPGQKYKGEIYSYNRERGFGFIRPRDSSQNVYFHISAFPARIQPLEGASVEFLLEDSKKGVAAREIVLL